MDTPYDVERELKRIQHVARRHGLRVTRNGDAFGLEVVERRGPVLIDAHSADEALSFEEIAARLTHPNRNRTA